MNLSEEKFVIKDGERIAQIVVSKHERVDWHESARLKGSERGVEGFGSTGVK